MAAAFEQAPFAANLRESIFPQKEEQRAMNATAERQTQQMPVRPRRDRTGAKGLAITGSGFMAFLGVVFLLGGMAVLGLHAFGRDDNGYYNSDTEHLQSKGYALNTDRINLGGPAGDVSPDDLLGTVRVKAESTNGKPVFVGIARTADA